jgi:hypothetical protein
MVVITEYLGEHIRVAHDKRDVRLSALHQRQLIAWFWKNKSEMVREIVCEECPEHGEEMK